MSDKDTLKKFSPSEKKMFLVGGKNTSKGEKKLWQIHI